ncbi:Fpg/Nei family DNA glycosylase [Canibacter sp. lx-45]|uniref:Fpg/Nei family DNA glycosylase n=1 Tax=Canibacter zhuwentaonis TaxID=2837491 RepID=UPI001BDD6901|nr:DNA-formamidopyrimidine glycosylase family protein [Canibacter zhuwentaonis]MBT1035071.1 Fpg/Nei family DNA glycosylase [Canibacter zhuwentaonis]
MPEGHSVHRIARQFARNFVGKKVEVSSPQGRFAAGAQLITGAELISVHAVGKQLFLDFDNQLCLRVHLGIYGAWDFSGDIKIHPSIQVHAVSDLEPVISSAKRQADEVVPRDEAAEDSVTSIGAPRRARLRMAEADSTKTADTAWPPEPVGQVRARLLSDTVCADLRGPTVCEVISAAAVESVLQRLGPDPANSASPEEKQRFLARATKKKTAIAAVLMDQAVIAGIGNVYRAEMLFRARLNPFTPANELSCDTLARLWDDWVKLLEIGIRVGQMITKDDLDAAAYQRALRERDARHWVYKKEGIPCEVCSTEIALTEFAARKLYWCPGCQK